LSAPARSSEHLRWLPAKSNRCAASAACLGRSPKVAAETAAEGKFLTVMPHQGRAFSDKPIVTMERDILQLQVQSF